MTAIQLMENTTSNHIAMLAAMSCTKPSQASLFMDSVASAKISAAGAGRLGGFQPWKPDLRSPLVTGDHGVLSGTTVKLHSQTFLGIPVTSASGSGAETGLKISLSSANEISSANERADDRGGDYSSHASVAASLISSCMGTSQPDLSLYSPYMDSSALNNLAAGYQEAPSWPSSWFDVHSTGTASGGPAYSLPTPFDSALRPPYLAFPGINTEPSAFQNHFHVASQQWNPVSGTFLSPVPASTPSVQTGSASTGTLNFNQSNSSERNSNRSTKQDPFTLPGVKQEADAERVGAVSSVVPTRNSHRSSGNRPTNCCCPVCAEAEAAGPAYAHMYKRDRHSCHHAGCGKVYKKSSHLKAHLRWHTPYKQNSGSQMSCGNRLNRTDEFSRLNAELASQRRIGTTAEKAASHPISPAGGVTFLMQCKMCDKKCANNDLAKHEKMCIQSLGIGNVDSSSTSKSEEKSSAGCCPPLSQYSDLSSIIEHKMSNNLRPPNELKNEEI